MLIVQADTAGLISRSSYAHLHPEAAVQHHRREQINKLAESVRRACDLATPVNVDNAVARLNGSIATVVDGGYEARIEKDGQRFTISLAGDQYETRRRFSIAHELGHLFLHMGYLIDEDKWASVGTYTDSVYYRYGYTTEEFEANEFAAALLMPRPDFVRIATQHQAAGGYRISAVAEHFCVSTEAALNRGRWLGLFSWE